MSKSSVLKNLQRLALLGLLAATGSAMADGTIYRCHALSGDLVFQDKPCNTSTATREARNNSAGDVVAVAPPPGEQDSGTPAIEHYARYLDFVSRDRREQQAVDAADAARLYARAEADRASAEAARPACDAYASSGECLNPDYEPPYAFFLPQPRYSSYHAPYRPAVPAKPISKGPRPLGPNQPPQRSTRSARSEILSLAP